MDIQLYPKALKKRTLPDNGKALVLPITGTPPSQSSHLYSLSVKLQLHPALFSRPPNGCYYISPRTAGYF